MPDYSLAIVAIYLLLLMVFLQAIIAAGAHRKQESYVPGIVDENLGPESFVFRSHRTFMNSLETVPLMVALAFIAMFVAMDAGWLAILMWVYLAARLAHMITYYLVATRKNPSLRSYFFMVGVLAQIILFGLVGFSVL
ncbi:MAPEG family protein [Cohaesibacter sp. ES.047]|uniref:MAPEG family protein n=1 Tax=Cohaesibacter sp. ES.047 TaxID=1798205 RepID=UPI0018D515A5|nr:MAPEG family protein [Cohaesibacter sp. ES.047]